MTRNRLMHVVRKILLVDLLKGLALTFRYQDPREIYTEQYPMQRPQVAERYRGAPRLNVNPETNETLCIACDLCALACPEHLIVVTSERNPNTRRKELTTFTYDLSRCMFCGLCEDACPTDCLELTQDFELANYTREGMIWDRQTLELGPKPTVYKKYSSLERRPPPHPKHLLDIGYNLAGLVLYLDDKGWFRFAVPRCASDFLHLLVGKPKLRAHLSAPRLLEADGRCLVPHEILRSKVLHQHQHEKWIGH